MHIKFVVLLGITKLCRTEHRISAIKNDELGERFALVNS